MGTGLGLASAYGIIKNHNGFINCYSELGHGTTFNVYFPVCEETYPPEEGVADGELVEGVPGGDETILFVDDDEEIITVGRKILASLGLHSACCQWRTGGSRSFYRPAGPYRAGDSGLRDAGHGGGVKYSRP